MGFGAVLIWSASVACVRSTTAGLGTLTAASATYLLAGVLACLAVYSSGRRRRELAALPRRYLAGCGGLFVAYMVSYYLALGLAGDHDRSLEVGLINYLWPALVMALSVPVLGRRWRWFLVPGLALAVAGTALATLSGQAWSWAALADRARDNWLPYLLALVAAVTWGLYSNLSRRWAGHCEEGAVPLFTLASGLVLLGLRLAVHEPPAAWTARAVAEVAFTAVFPAFLGYYLWETAMRRGNMTLVAAASYFTPVLSVVLASIYLKGGIPSRELWLGCALVTAGAVVSKLAIVEEPPGADPAPGLPASR
jgi:drug/metabolite transporter (DMT)-like permease